MMNWRSLVIYIRYIHLFHGAFFTPFTLGKSFRAVCSGAGEISEYLWKKIWPNASPVRELGSGVGFSCDDTTLGGPDPTNWGIGFQLFPFWVFLMNSDHLAVPAAVTPLPWQHPHLRPLGMSIPLFRDEHHLMSCNSGTM